MNKNDTTKRRDWQIMQQKVARAFIQLYRENQRQPTNAELAKEIGVSERTIIRHLKSLDFADYFVEQRNAFAPLMETVMMAIYNSTIKGKVPAQKLMLQIVFGWAEPKSYEQPERQTSETSEEELAELERGIELLVKMRERQQRQKAIIGIINTEKVNKKELGVLDHFPTESLKLVKPDGSEIENVIGLVSTGSKKITIEDVSLDIEEGDTIVRDLPNGKQEYFTVIDPGFARGMGGHIPDHYNVSFERVSKLPKANTHGSGYITVVNEGGRVNINSTDNSINIQVSNDTERLFSELTTALEETKDQALMDAVSELKQAVGTTGYAEKYNKFIQNAANHMTLVAPFLPAISALLVN